MICKVHCLTPQNVIVRILTVPIKGDIYIHQGYPQANTKGNREHHFIRNRKKGNNARFAFQRISSHGKVQERVQERDYVVYLTVMVVLLS